MRTDRRHEANAAHALDALDGRQRTAAERHFRACSACRDELRALREVAAAIALATEPVAPPGYLLERILAGARTDPRPRSRRTAWYDGGRPRRLRS